ncbi:MAG: tetratricopeptide repeat protein, partial [Deltaproteobacteria bacterium]|nr:tetratricopeptide repeat protein [Deltaproteobacteria bacterium]
MLLVFLDGCAFNPLRDDAPTIASLDKKPVRIEDTPVEPSESRAMIAYRDFLDNDRASKERPQAMRRLADLGLESDGTAVEKTASGVEDVLALYPDRKDNDSVLYQLARAYEHDNQPEVSLATLKQLIALYPDSPYTVEAHFRSGEIQFVEKHYREAGLSYRQVVAAGNSSPFLRQSLYKLGWCDFKQGLYPEGIDSFMALLDRLFQDAASGEQQLKGLSR